MALHPLTKTLSPLMVGGLLTFAGLVQASGGAAEQTTLAAFAGSNGADPSALLLGVDGNFYGTTFQGGNNGLGFPFGLGIVFKLTPAGTLTTLVSFGSTNGAKPYAALVQGLDGSLYGTTSQGGTSNFGTVFRVTTNGILTSMLSFTQANGAIPSARLTLGRDGFFYGTTRSGGTSNQGTVFRMTTNGVLTTLVSFNDTNGAHPYAEVFQGLDGNFYGTTVYGGGPSDAGTVFRMTTNGTLTTLLSFNGTNGANPEGGLVEDASGLLYGTTVYGGASLNGTIFKITTNGALTTLYSFTYGDDGANPSASLLLGSDRSFYGTTKLGGSTSGVPRGTVFQITTNGSFASLIAFNFDTNGISPLTALVQDSVGDLYGTTSIGGVGLKGTVFRLTPGPRVLQAAIQPGNIFQLRWDAWLGKQYQVQYRTNATQTGWIDLANPFIATNSPLTVDASPAGPSRFYRVKLIVPP